MDFVSAYPFNDTPSTILKLSLNAIYGKRSCVMMQSFLHALKVARAFAALQQTRQRVYGIRTQWGVGIYRCMRQRRLPVLHHGSITTPHRTTVRECPLNFPRTDASALVTSPDEFKVGDSVECADWDDPYPIGEIVEIGEDDGVPFITVRVERGFYEQTL